MSLIKCSDGKWAPAVIACIHVTDGTATEYVKVPSPEPGSEMDDCLCPYCFEKGPHGLSIDDLVTVCMHCLREQTSTMTDVSP
jgi:hypothetical protein